MCDSNGYRADMSKDHAAQQFWRDKHRDPAFLHERDSWYAKAMESGFRDLEMTDALTKEPSTHLLKGMSPGDLWRGLYKPDAEEFYTLARQHTQRLSEDYETRERHIWEMYADGHSVDKVHRALGKRYGFSRAYVAWIIKYETKRMLRLLNTELDAQRTLP